MPKDSPLPAPIAAPISVWQRRDLRVADQPAFHAAAAGGAPVVPVYVLDDEGAGSRALGGASRWWLHHSLTALDKDLRSAGSRLILRRGPVARELVGVAKEIAAREVHALAHHESWWRKAEAEVAGMLDLHLHDGNYLGRPGTLLTGGGTPYRMFTPFWRALEQEMPPPEPLPAPNLVAPAKWPWGDALEEWNLLPHKPDWAGGLHQAWRVGEAAAHDQLGDFLHRVGDYETARNLPSIDGSSRLSPHLHWGELSPRQVWHAFDGRRGIGAQCFRRELGWRDFAQGLIAQFPDYGEHSFREEYRRLAWRDPQGEAAGDLAAWQQGRTGYPIVDAGMRQLWATGWMHNRVRMIGASFLIKHLLIDWRHGERWFWDTLVDADYASNAVNWQWVSGSGVDASLFSRIMAPLVQSPKFDAAGYIREWVPELAGLSDADIHDPVFRPAGYPAPVIGHREARERALAAYREVKSGL